MIWLRSPQIGCPDQSEDDIRQVPTTNPQDPRAAFQQSALVPTYEVSPSSLRLVFANFPDFHITPNQLSLRVQDLSRVDEQKTRPPLLTPSLLKLPTVSFSSSRNATATRQSATSTTTTNQFYRDSPRQLGIDDDGAPEKRYAKFTTCTKWVAGLTRSFFQRGWHRPRARFGQNHDEENFAFAV